MDKRDYLIAAAILLVSTSAAFGVGSLFFNSSQPQKYSELFNVTVDADNSAETVNFDGNSLQLMFETRQESRMYIDTDVDGSFDIELTDLTRDGQKQTVTQLVTYNNTSYRLHFRYRDNPDKSGESFLTLYQIREL